MRPRLHVPDVGENCAGAEFTASRAIAPASMLQGYHTDCATAFLAATISASDTSTPDWRALTLRRIFDDHPVQDTDCGGRARGDGDDGVLPGALGVQSRHGLNVWRSRQDDGD